MDQRQMNLIIASGIATRNEIAQLSSAANWLISHTTGTPALGQVDDSIIGTAELTRSGVLYDKYHSMLLFQNTTYLPLFDDVTSQGITGRQLVSKILEETPINFTRSPEWYKPHMAAWMKYNPDEIKVKIDQGKHISGIMDKKSIGKGASGGLYHLIAIEYGNDKALEVMFNMQQMAIAHILQYGYTIGIMDLLVSKKAKAEIDRIAADIVNKSYLITEKLNNGEIIPPIGKSVEEFYEEQQINVLNVYDDFTETILSSIDSDTNNLFKLVMMGSKGKLDNIYNMMSAIGQKLINGERIRQKFGFKRTLAYFSRFDTSPEARGYIPDSYLGGMTSWGYVFNAMAARFDIISKVLSTSVTGEQNRKSIKNLESIIVNNFRWAAKGENIIQFVYGENFLDSRHVEKVKFPTVMISDEAFEKKYKYNGEDKLFEEEYNCMKADRIKYRQIFFRVENMNTKEMFSDERKMSIDIERIIRDTLHDYSNKEAHDKSNKSSVLEMTKHIHSFCEVIPYILINEIQERRKTPIPEYIRAATWLMTMLIRSHLHSNALVEYGMTMPILNIITNKIRLKFTQALIEPGSAVGIIAAQSFSEPLTQYMLDAHHRSAAGGTSKTGMIRTKEVLGAKDVNKLASPGMIIPVLPEFESNQVKVQEIANNIEVMRLRQFVVMWQIFFEKYGDPIAPRYKHETAMISEFAKLNPLLTPPGDLVKWCIRMVLNKTTLILKNMSLELIITKLREAFPDIYIVYTPENAKLIVLRIYIKNTMFKGHIETANIKLLGMAILESIIRGVNNIINTNVIKMLRNRISGDGSIVKNDNIYVISTNGTNLRGIFTNKFVDVYNVQTDAIREVEKSLGIEAARQKIISELRNIIDICYMSHYLMYADEMTYTGKVTSVERSGLSTREAGNILLRIGFSSPIQTLEEAALNSSEDTITGVTAPLLVGSTPRIGTLYNKFIMNSDFIRKNVKRPDDWLATLE